MVEEPAYKCAILLFTNILTELVLFTPEYLILVNAIVLITDIVGADNLAAISCMD